MKDMRQNEKDISEANKEIEAAKADIEAAEAKISDLYSFADGEIKKWDILAGNDWETGFDGDNYITNGDLELKHPYTDYDFLLFIYCGNSFDVGIRIEPVWKIQKVFEIFQKTTPYGKFPSYVYIWDSNAIGARCFTTNVRECTDTLWKNFGSNTHFYSVIGVKIKEDRK